MSENCEYIDSILERSGRDQEQRFNEKLDPDNLKLHDLDIEDWMLFAYNFAKHVNYFDTNNDNTPSGNWQDLFRYFEFDEETIPLRGATEYQKIKEQITAKIAAQESEAEITPHFTLFICFLKLLSLSRERFNNLTKRHLDFYFEEILKVEKLPASEDKVHILFEIAKKSVEERVPEATALDGGKDTIGVKRIYKTTEELIANKIKVSALKNVYNDADSTRIKISEIANSYGGDGETFPDEEENSWWPFGYPKTETEYPELQNASIGFAIASPLLLLQEGERKLKITITFEENLRAIGTDELVASLSCYASGEEEWIGPLALDTSVSQIIGNQLIIGCTLAKDVPAILPYNNEVLGGNFDTDFPLFRVFIKQEDIDLTQAEQEVIKGYDLYTTLANQVVETITVTNEVTGIKSLNLENDTGKINAEKPFFPFTTQPLKKSNFYINYNEAFSKQWTEMSIYAEWKNTPDPATSSFTELYEGYSVSGVSDSYFTVRSAMYANEEWEIIQNDSNSGDLITGLFNKNAPTNSVYEFKYSLSNAGRAYKANYSGPLRISLNQSFLHDVFPRVYAVQIAKAINDTLGDEVVPQEAYTPLVEFLTMDYKAEETTDFSVKTETAYQNNRIQLFHINPFGQNEEHGFLKEIKITKDVQDQNDLAEISEGISNGLSETQAKNLITNSYLIPTYCQGGSLYIGLEEAEISQQVSLLIQVLEGSENPKADSFEGKQRVEWSVLCQNQWKDLEESMIINNIDNFLSSGIVRFTIPKEATKENTRLLTGLTWVRARMHKTYDVVSKVKAIHAQAVVAVFEDQGNELSHLESGLPDGTISKLITRVPQIKSITQPYTSFDGQPQESDDAYYRRISERLRHKNRAITLWDYESLVLQEFPEIYQVKCLNHTNDSSFLSPGDVTLVVIPDTINKNVFDIFQPRVSKALLNKVASFINKLNSMHVTAAVINPSYEEVEISLSVKFYEGYDESFYAKQLSEDITKFLSPWAFDTSRSIDFGVTLHRSILIDYIEKLAYVDYLQDVIMKKDDEVFGNSIAPSNPSSILVSAKTHQIDTAIQTCKTTFIEEIEKCQI
ncbi:baseplate J/gp47 family protein [Aquimarina pacifica]|uniref:baseplate J/gp47 family protein n=1 Tax=Aquimarina pacifica TaxID=1296415 RepID=UPI0004708C73|nr:baseplate J/gp47 family protein [Aquimarina pacifica]